jgi:SSS family solute:Na+ symporter
VYQQYVKPNATHAHYINVGRVLVLALLLIGYALSVTTFEFLVVLVALSGAGALLLMPAILGVCFPTRPLLSRTGVIAGIGVGLVTLFITLVTFPHPLGLHGGVWSVFVNFLVTIVVSRATRAPSPETVQRIHGEVERFVPGTASEQATTEPAAAAAGTT